MSDDPWWEISPVIYNCGNFAYLQIIIVRKTAVLVLYCRLVLTDSCFVITRENKSGGGPLCLDQLDQSSSYLD